MPSIKSQDNKEAEWRQFSLYDVFEDIKRGKRLKKENHLQGNTPYISSRSFNNGIDGFVSNKENVRKYESCLTVANSGSVGSCFYHPYVFVASDHVTALISKQISKHSALFISSLISRFSSKYNFNREINDYRISREKILLPINDFDDPDYSLMEEYVRERDPTSGSLHPVRAYPHRGV